jgi:hypothetical protein
MNIDLGLFSVTAHAWTHSAVPLGAIVQSEVKGGTSELVAFGWEGAASEFGP